jgi:RNA polymerase sigma factor (sigma-70 family)
MLNFQDEASFRAFINEHQSRVFNIVLKMVQQLDDAEEITQDVFVDVYHKPGIFRGESSVTTWLYRIAMNKSIDHLRRKKKRNLFGYLQPWMEAGTDFYHPGVRAENKENASLLFRAMKKLPEKQYQAWVLSEMEDLSYKEISEVMQVSLSSVESLLFRARQNLRKFLSGMYPGGK